ncbi:MAG: hypothetical protein Q4D17_10470, partial [Planctomycetia bacterium]|nr:hypothetical protein [Planctomycetia bacterium]
ACAPAEVAPACAPEEAAPISGCAVPAQEAAEAEEAAPAPAVEDEEASILPDADPTSVSVKYNPSNSIVLR